MEPDPPQPIAVKATPSLPWDRDDFYGFRPIDSDFGYYEPSGRWPRRRLCPQACTQEELIARVEDMSASGIAHVWTPESATVRSIREVPFFHHAVVQRMRKSARSGIKTGLFHLVLWASLAWLMVNFAPEALVEYAPLLGLPALFLGLAPLIRGCLTLMPGRSYSVSSLRRTARTMRFQEWLARGRAPTVRNLCVVLIAIGVMQFFTDDATRQWLPASIKSAGLMKYEVRNGEYWRLITGTLLHYGHLHLFMNCFALFFLGRFVVRLTNGPTASLTLFLAALGGSLASLVFLPGKASVGFSGAILGLLGFLVALGRRRPHVIPRNFRRLLMGDLIFITLVGLAAYKLFDNAAHMGGLGTGWLIGMAVISRRGSSFPVVPRAGVNVLGWISHTVLLGFAAFTLWKISGFS